MSLWSAAADVTLLDSRNLASRVVVAAPWWWLVVGAALVTVVPAWRRQLSLVAPALVATVPWWPVPLPAAALVWTGKLAWVPVAAAVIAGWAGGPPSARAVSAREGDEKSGAPASPGDAVVSSRSLRQAVTAGALSFGVAALVAWSVAPRLPGGDEPAYLIIAQSLLKDGDLRIENNHQQRDYASFFDGDLAPDFVQRGRGEVIYSIHAPGTAVFVLPLFALFGYAGAQVSVMAACAVAAALTWWAAWMATHDRRAAWFAWAAICVSTTFLIQSVMVFPDGPATAAVAGALVVLMAIEAGRLVYVARLAATGAVLAALPWFHTRFALLSAGLGLAIVALLMVDDSRPVAARIRRSGAFLVVPVLGAVAWLAYFWILYGSANPSIAYGTTSPASWRNVPGGLVGLLFDAQFGLLAFAPVLALAAVGTFRRSTAPVGIVPRLAVLVALVYCAGTALYWMWWAGVPATPARFVTATLPLLAPVIAIAWQRASSYGRAAGMLLLGWSLAVAFVVIGVDHGAMAWNTRGSAAAWLGWLGGVTDLAHGWPSFFRKLDPDNRMTEWPFVAHVAVWLSCLAGSAALVGVLVRARASRLSTAGAAAWWLLLGLPVTLQASWRLEGLDGIHVAASQLRTLGATSRGSLSKPAALQYLAAKPAPSDWRIATTAETSESRAEWSSLVDVPAGSYQLVLHARRPAPGILTVAFPDRRPFEKFDVPGQSEVTFELRLPAGATQLDFSATGRLASVGGTLILRPTSIEPVPMSAPSRVLRQPLADVFFADDEAFVEPDGFWVKGTATATFLIAPRDPSTAVVLELSNGSRVNSVDVGIGEAVRETAELQPSESRRLRNVPIITPTIVRVSSGSGFRPSETGSSDRRWLGVRVRVVESTPIQ